VTASRVYESTMELPDLSTVVVDVYPGARTKTRSDRTQLLVTQEYVAHIRRRFEGAELDGAKVAASELDDWTEFVQNLENVKWAGKFSSLNASIQNVEITAPYDAAILRERSTLAAVVTFTAQWFKAYQ
jgi:hypothetical protein